MGSLRKRPQSVVTKIWHRQIRQIVNKFLVFGREAVRMGLVPLAVFLGFFTPPTPSYVPSFSHLSLVPVGTWTVSPCLTACGAVYLPGGQTSCRPRPEEQGAETQRDLWGISGAQGRSASKRRLKNGGWVALVDSGGEIRIRWPLRSL